MSATIRDWSQYQTNIFDFGVNGTGNAIIEAVAGSGKTTTVVELARRMQGSSIYLAFNKKNATELASRGVNARTFHSMCYSPVLKFKKQYNVNANKLRDIVDMNMAPVIAKTYGQFAIRLVGLARQFGIGCLTPDTYDAWLDLVEHHDLQPEGDNGTIEGGIGHAQALFRASNESQQVDFDDLLYIAVKEGLSLPKFDNVFVDEAQDTNAIQRAILRKIMKSTSRLFAVGDSAQAIYGFRGADSDSMDLIAQEFNCTKLPLTVSYRCPQAVVRHAKQWVSHIEHSPSAPEGEVEHLGTKFEPTTFQPNDMVVCRTTKPLIELAYRCLKAHVGVSIAGRDIGASLKTLINRMKANSVDVLLTKLSAYTTREVEKAIAKKDDDKAERIQDKTDAIFCLIDGLDEDHRSVSDLLAVIDRLFSEQIGVVQLSTIHKAKGLEAQHVYWLNSSKCPAKWARQDWQLQQEHNLCYVATTRAMSKLTLIEDGASERKIA